MDENNKDWRFCAVGNITAQHLDEDGKVLYGSKAFSGGTKVYIDDKTMDLNRGSVNVIGMNRFGRYVVDSVSVDLVENVRVQTIFKPEVLRIMDSLEAVDGWFWRGRTAKDRKALHAFVETWKGSQTARVQGGESEQ